MDETKVARPPDSASAEQLWIDYTVLFMRALEGALESDCRRALAILEAGKARRAAHRRSHSRPHGGLRLISNNGHGGAA